MAEAWRSRHVLLDLAHPLLSAMWKNTILGPIWIPIQVGITTIGLAVVFGGLISPDTGEIPYYLFVAVGMLAWRIFDRSLIFTIRSFYRYRRLTSELRVPLVFIPIAMTAMGLVEWGVYLLFILGTIVYYSITGGTVYLNFSPELILAPVGLFWALLLAWGIGFVTGPIFVRARDIRYLLRLVVPFLVFITPVMYPLSQLKGIAAILAQVNPMTAVVELVRLGLFGVGNLGLVGVCSGVAVTIVALILGLVFLGRFGSSLIGAIPRGYMGGEEEP